MILIKLGGSIITNKKKPLSPRKAAINKIAKQFKKINEPFAVIHGGGSFGHYWSVKYNMHTIPAKYNIRGMVIVKTSMIELNKIILDSFLKNKFNPYCLPPTDFINKGKPIKSKILEIEKISKSGLIPISYGDALWYGKNKSYILSGDKRTTPMNYCKRLVNFFKLFCNFINSCLSWGKRFFFICNNRASKFD